MLDVAWVSGDPGQAVSEVLPTRRRVVDTMRLKRIEAEASVFDETKGFYETRVVECDDPVNSRWVDGKLVPVNPNCESCGVELKSDPSQDDEFTCWCHQCNVKRTAQPPTQQSLAL
jgi:hypothetical protein